MKFNGFFCAIFGFKSDPRPKPLTSLVVFRSSWSKKKICPCLENSFVRNKLMRFAFYTAAPDNLLAKPTALATRAEKNALDFCSR
jgi:hypothetical protein